MQPPLNSLSDAQFDRYGRQIMLADWGEEGQLRLANAKVLIIGCGGLGTAAGLYLAGAGVGQLILADDNAVARSNLPRQLAYRETDLGSNKSQALAVQLKAINHHIRCRAVKRRLEGAALLLEVSLADMVLDCSDNMATRQAVNAACVEHRKPLVAGAAIGWQGQLMTFDFRHSLTPCYHCLFPTLSEPQPRNCQSAGVAGPVVGAIGNLQALEAIKCLLGAKFDASFYQFDGHSVSLTKMAVPYDPGCAVCQHDTNVHKEVSGADLVE